MKERKILIVTLEPVAGKMAGPAIRSLEIGRQLAKDFSVTVYSPIEAQNANLLQGGDSTLEIATGGGRNRLYQLSEQSDILFIQANVLKAFPALARSGKYLVVDLYDPYLFSLLEQYTGDQATADSSFRLCTRSSKSTCSLAILPCAHLSGNGTIGLPLLCAGKTVTFYIQPRSFAA